MPRTQYPAQPVESQKVRSADVEAARTVRGNEARLARGPFEQVTVIDVFTLWRFVWELATPDLRAEARRRLISARSASSN